MATVLTIFHVFICLFLILVVLLQAGKGGGMGLAFGGTSNTVFGGSGAGNFLSRLTAATAILFMITSLTLAYMSSPRGSQGLRDISQRARQQAEAEAAKKKQLEIDAGMPVMDAATADEPAGEVPGEEATPVLPEGVPAPVTVPGKVPGTVPMTPPAAPAAKPSPAPTPAKPPAAVPSPTPTPATPVAPTPQ